jgi:hypothetical protein
MSGDGMNNWRFKRPEEGVPIDDDYAIALADAEGEIVLTPENVLAKLENAFLRPFVDMVMHEYTAAYGGPSWPAGTMCETCGGFIPSGLVCSRCPKEGFVKCPNIHEKAKSACVSCRATPGFVQELKNE